MPPAISVLIPAFNAEDYLGQAIESVFKDAEDIDLEVLVVDDGSTDRTRAIAQSFGGCVRYHWMEHCGRPGKVRNHGLARASGDYVAFLDADDFCLPGRLKRQLQLARNAVADVIFSDATVVFDNTSKTISWLEKVGAKAEIEAATREHVLRDPFGLLLKCGSFIIPSLALVRRTCLAEIEFFDEDLRCSEDFDLFVRLATRFRFAFQPEALVVRRVLLESVSSNRWQRVVDGLKVCEKIERLCSMKEAGGRIEWQICLRRERARLYREQGALFVQRNDRVSARKSWGKSLWLLFSPQLLLYMFASFLASPRLMNSWLARRWLGRS